MLDWLWKKKEPAPAPEPPPPPKTISFKIADVEYLRISEGGEFYVRGELVATDKDVYVAMKKFLEDAAKRQQQQ